MTLIIIIASCYGLSCLIDYIRDQKRRKRLEEIRMANVEQQSQEEEKALLHRQRQERAIREWKRAKAEDEARMMRMIELAKERGRAVAEAKQEACVVASTAPEQVEKLEFQLDDAERTIAHFTPILDSIRREYEEKAAKVEHYEKIGLPCGGIKNEVYKLGSRLYTIESRVRKAQFVRDQAAQKLSA